MTVDPIEFLTVQADIAGTGDLHKFGDGRLTLGTAIFNQLSYTGATHIHAGLFEVAGTLNTSSVTLEGGVQADFIGNNFQEQLKGNVLTTLKDDASLLLSSSNHTGSVNSDAASTIDVTNAWKLKTAGNSSTINGTLKGAGSFEVNDNTGSGVTINGTNTLTGPISVIAGTLTLNSNTNASSLTAGPLGKLVVNRPSISANITANGTLEMGGNVSGTYSGAISGAGNFFKKGTNSVTLVRKQPSYGFDFCGRRFNSLLRGQQIPPEFFASNTGSVTIGTNSLNGTGTGIGLSGTSNLALSDDASIGDLKGVAGTAVLLGNHTLTMTTSTDL